MVKLKQVDTPFEMDDNQVAKCIEMADNLDKQLAEDEKKAELLHTYGFDRKKENARFETKSKEQVLEAARKALKDDDAEKVVNGKDD